MGKTHLLLSLLGLAVAAVAACGDAPPSELSSAERTDARIRSELTSALSIAALCSFDDRACHERVLDDVASGSSSDVTVGAIAAAARKVGRAEICRHLALGKDAAIHYAFGGSIGAGTHPDNGAEIVFDLDSPAGPAIGIFTYWGASVASLLEESSTHESMAIAPRDADLVAAWSGPISEAPPSFDLRGATAGFTASPSLRGVAGSIDAPTVASSLDSLVVIDGSTFAPGMSVSAPSMQALERRLEKLGPTVRGRPEAGYLAFGETVIGDATLHPAMTAAIAIVRLAGFDGMGPKAAAIAIAAHAITREHGGNLDAYCSTVAPRTLSVQSLGVGPRDATAGGGANALDDAFKGITMTSETTPAGDCATDADLACDVAYRGRGLVCASRGSDATGKYLGSCCKTPTEVTKSCSSSSQCGDGEICTTAFEDAGTKVLSCQPASDVCAATPSTPAPLPQGSSASTTTTLHYLGSAKFLRECAGATLGCGRAVSSVSDSTPYFAAPRAWGRDACEQWYTFRVNGRCVEAQRLEVSDRRNFIEGNPAVFAALGLDHSDGSRCSGSGTAPGVRMTPGRRCN